MTKSRWMTVVEWCVLALIALFTIGILLTGADEDSGRKHAPLMQLDD